MSYLHRKVNLSAGRTAYEQAEEGHKHRRTLLLQLAFAATVAGPCSARDFILPLDSNEKLPPGVANLLLLVLVQLHSLLCAKLLPPNRL